MKAIACLFGVAVGAAAAAPMARAQVVPTLPAQVAPATEAQASGTSRAQVGPTPPASGLEGEVVELSLEDAVERATEQSEEVRLARSQVELAEAQITEARSAALPQINANLGYTRTFASPFQSGSGFELPDSLRFDPDPTAPLADRVDYLERATPLAGLGGLGQLFGDLPFGQENTYVAGLSASQLLYAGGRVGAALDIADNFREAAQFTLDEQVAEIELQVRTAYYQALLARELEAISEAALAQAQSFLEQERLRERAGRASELDVLRAEVSLENLRPQLVEARNAASLALLNLKRLVDIPLTQPVELTTELKVPAPGELAAPAPDPEALMRRRSAIAAAERQVAIAEQQVRIAKAAYLPTVSLQVNYGRQLFPSGAFDFDGEWRTDWTAGLSVQIPIFQGLRRSADVRQAEVEVERSRLQLGQLRESVQLQYEQAAGERERASAAIAARQRTVDQAQRVHDLTVLRYDRGLATQLEVSEARLALLQARTNLAQALTDFYIADAGLVRALGGVRIASASGDSR